MFKRVRRVVYNKNRTLHGRLGILFFSFSVEKNITHTRLLCSLMRYFPTLEKKLPDSAWPGNNGEFKQQRFLATHVNRKWAFFSFHSSWRYQICIAKFLYSKREVLPKRCSSPLPVDVRRSKTSLLGSSIGKAFLSDVRQPGGLCVDATEFVLLCPGFLNKSDYLPENLPQNHCPRMQKAHFRLMCAT